MSETLEQTPVAAPATLPIHRVQCTCKHRFCTRRNHALVAIPLLCFVVAHLAVAATGVSASLYQANVNRIHSLGAFLLPLEVLFVFVPLAAQVYFGLKLLYKSGLKFRTDKHHRGSPMQFFLQRVSAVVMLAFILFHVATLNAWGLHALYRATGAEALSAYRTAGLFDATRAYESTAAGIGAFFGVGGGLANAAIAGFYLLGIWATCYHVVNGISTAGVALGFAMTDQSQRYVNRVCLVGGLVLGAVGTAAWYAFVR